MPSAALDTRAWHGTGDWHRSRNRAVVLVPESSSATALFEIRIKQESIVNDAVQQSTQDYEILKKTQLAILKVSSSSLLPSAILASAALSILAGELDKEEWLQEHLGVEFPQNG